MDDLRENLFSGTALPGDQYRQIGRGYLHGHFNGPVQIGRIADDPEPLLYCLYIHG